MVTKSICISLLWQYFDSFIMHWIWNDFITIHPQNSSNQLETDTFLHNSAEAFGWIQALPSPQKTSVPSRTLRCSEAAPKSLPAIDPSRGSQKVGGIQGAPFWTQGTVPNAHGSRPPINASASARWNANSAACLSHEKRRRPIGGIYTERISERFRPLIQNCWLLDMFGCL